MADTNTITKIYDVRLLGAEDAIKRLASINDSFSKILQTKKELSKQTSSIEDSAQLQELKQKLEAVTAEELKLKIARKEAMNELKAYEVEKQKEINSSKLSAGQNTTLQGSYNALYTRYKELNKELRATPTSAPQFQSLQAEVKGLKTQVDDFNRSFSASNKPSVLGEMLKNQSAAIKQELSKLDSEFKTLQKDLSTIGTSGTGGLDSLEKKMLQNRQAATSLEQQFEKLQIELKGLGGVGTQVSEGLKNGFQNLSGNITQLALGYVGFQAAISGIKDSFAEFDQAETNSLRLQNALRNMGKEKYFDELKAQADELAKKLGYIDNDDIVKAQEKLVTFGKLSTKQIKEAIPTIVDLSANLGVTIPEAAGVFLKAIEGNAKALKEYGINIKDGGSEVERFAILQTQLATKVAGSADTMSQSAAGGFRKLKQVFADAKEDVGRSIAEAIDPQQLAATVKSLTQLLVLLVQAITAIPFSAVAAGFLLWKAGVADLIPLKARLFVAMQLEKGAAAFEALQDKALAAGKAVLRAAVSALALAKGVLTGQITLASGAAISFRAVMTALSGPLGIVLGIIGLLGTAFASLSFRNKESNDALVRQQELLKVNAELQAEVARQTGATKDKIQSLVGVITNVNSSYEEKRKALQKLIAISPEYLKGLTLENINTQEGINIISRYIKALDLMADAKARFDLKTKLRAQLLESTNKQQALEVEQKDAPNSYGFKFIPSLFGKQNKGTLQDDIDKEKQEQDKIKLQLNALDFSDKQQVDSLRKSIEDKTNKLKTLKKGSEEAKRLAQDIASEQSAMLTMQGIETSPSTTTDASNLSAEDKEKKVNTESLVKKAFDKELKLLEENSKLQKEKLHQAQLEKKISEEQYVKDVAVITKQELEDKIKLYEKYKPKEVGTIASFNTEKIQLEKDTQNKLKEIRQNSFDKQEALIKKEYDTAKAIAELNLKKVTGDTNATPAERAEAEKVYYNTILGAQQQFNQKMDQLEKTLKLSSQNNATQRALALLEAAQTLKNALLNIQKQQAEEQLRSGAAALQRQKAEAATILANQIDTIGEDPRLSARAKKEKIDKAKADTQTLALASEEAAAKIHFETMQNLYNQGLQTEQEFLQSKERLANARIALIENKNAQEIEKEKQKAEILNQLAQSGLQIANDLAQAMFESDREKLEKLKDYKMERLNIEKEQVMAQAQSQAERDSLEKQYEQKKKAIEKESFERMRQQKKKELAIQLTLELANIAAQAAANPSNAFTFGAAGALQYAILAAVALARYGIGVNRINAQEFARGGMLGKILNVGGIFRGPAHKHGGIPFLFKGQAVEVEGEEGYVIKAGSMQSNKRFTVTGTPAQLASAANVIAGGVNFAPGFMLRPVRFEYGGTLGSSLQAPVFTSAQSIAESNNANSEDNAKILEALKAQAIAIAEQNKRIDNIKVHVVTREITTAQKKDQQSTQLATL